MLFFTKPQTRKDISSMQTLATPPTATDSRRNTQESKYRKLIQLEASREKMTPKQLDECEELQWRLHITDEQRAAHVKAIRDVVKIEAALDESCSHESLKAERDAVNAERAEVDAHLKVLKKKSDELHGKCIRLRSQCVAIAEQRAEVQRIKRSHPLVF